MREVAFLLLMLQKGETEAQRSTYGVTWAIQKPHPVQWNAPSSLSVSGILTLGNWRHFVETSRVGKEEMAEGEAYSSCR